RPSRDCTADTVVALCDRGECRFYGCSAVAPALGAVRRLRNADGTWVPLPGAIGMRPESRAGRIPSSPFFTSGVGAPFVEASAQALPEHALENPSDRDVIQRMLVIGKPGDVAQWWRAGPRMEPERWAHPLSEWERAYLETMSAPTVADPVRMWAPVNPERLTPEQLDEAERLFGVGPDLARAFANWENRRRMVGHYVWTHPATIRLLLTGYGFARDTHPLSFALERGWQVAGGKEMFTQEDVSRLGAVAEFFTALAVGFAANKVMLSVRPAPPEGIRPPSEPIPAPRREGTPPPVATGKVIPLDRARVARNTGPGTQPSPAKETPPLAATGTDGPPGRRGGSSRGPSVTREDSNGSAKPSGPREDPEAAGLASIGASGECSGQFHHVISRPIARALNDHRTLKGLHTERDPRFVTRAADKASHNGYQRWHRDVDTEVIRWITDHPDALPAHFEAMLREIYNRPAMRARFPDGF
ncbi:MAG TPA: hypothetical protein VK447_06725, partial [Myxococcaceae bacterium]|nr:hypothetical protein [Myxococcaceae bacterium]